jgi:hypothetical protein
MLNTNMESEFADEKSNSQVEIVVTPQGVCATTKILFA